MRLSRALRDGVAAVCIVGTVASTIAVAPAEAAASAGVEVRVASSHEFSRVEFRGARPKVSRQGQTVRGGFFCQPVIGSTFTTASTMISSSSPACQAARKNPRPAPSRPTRRPSVSIFASGAPTALQGPAGRASPS